MVAELERSGDLEAFRQLGGHVLIALDGTEYHVSSKVHCQQCSTRKRGHDRTEHFHALVSATVVATVCDLAEDLWRKAMEKMGTRGRFFENLRSITTFLIFPTWDDLLATLAFARPPPVAS